MLSTNYDELLRPKARNLLDEENIVFHHHEQAASGFNPAITDGKEKKLDEDGNEVPDGNNEMAEM